MHKSSRFNKPVVSILTSTTSNLPASGSADHGNNTRGWHLGDIRPARALPGRLSAASWQPHRCKSELRVSGLARRNHCTVSSDQH